MRTRIHVHDEYILEFLESQGRLEELPSPASPMEVENLTRFFADEEVELLKSFHAPRGGSEVALGKVRRDNGVLQWWATECTCTP